MAWVGSVPEDALGFSLAVLCRWCPCKGGQSLSAVFMTRCSFFLSARVVFPYHAMMPLVRMCNKAPVGLGEGLIFKASFHQHPDEVQPLLGPFHCGNSVVFPAEAISDVKAEEFVAVGPLHHCPIDGEWLQRGGGSSPVTHNY